MVRIVITGAAGNLGGKLVAHFGAVQSHDLVLLDRLAGPGISAADISQYDTTWTESLRGADIVIHLAGEIRPVAHWSQVHPANVTGTANVLRAAQAANVPRVVFASTNQVMGGYRFRSDIVSPDSPPLPLNPYAVSKLIGEEMGRAFATETGADFVAFRIGNIWPGENLPGPDLGIGSWGQEMWLSNRDMVHAVECALTAPKLGFAVLNLVSDNPGMRWDIEPTRRLIGYHPQDGQAVVMTDQVKAQDDLARQAVLVPGSWLDQNSRHLDA